MAAGSADDGRMSCNAIVTYGAGHLPHMEKAGEVNRLIVRGVG